jgi:hypothetical protein
MSSVEYRLGNIIEHDWRAEAAELLKEREAGLVSGSVSAFPHFFSRRADDCRLSCCNAIF